MTIVEKDIDSGRVIGPVEALMRRGIVKEVPDISHMHERIKARVAEGKPIKVIYGETFDGTNTLDSVRAYLTLNTLIDALKKTGAKVDAKVLICDLNEALERGNTEKVRSQAQDRMAFVQRVKDTYKCSFDIVLQSSRPVPDGFKSLGGGANVEELMRAVPLNKRKAAAANRFEYVALELAEIMGYDVKLGPPRERLYDNIAMNNAAMCGLSELIPVYLATTYPLGLRFEDYVDYREMGEYGLTPYRSLGRFKNNRIRIGETTPQMAKELIDNTQISSQEHLPNPITPITMAGTLATNHLQGDIEASASVFGQADFTFFCRGVSYELKPEALKDVTYRAVKENILDVLRG